MMSTGQSYIIKISKIIKFGRTNELNRLKWVKDALTNIPAGKRVLDAGAGELRNKQFCGHLVYVSQDICQYEGKGDGVGLQTGTMGLVYKQANG